MSQYTTGELAKQCGVTVRTVQFYDQKGILIPSALSEGGRRLYSDEDLKKMKIICFLRDTGLSLDTIGQLQWETGAARPDVHISAWARRREKLERLAELQKSVKNDPSFSLETIGDVANVMEGKKKLSAVHRNMILPAIPLGILQWASILLWIIKGVWWPFAAWVVLVIPYGIWVTRYYHRNVAYICPRCHEVFRPTMKEMLWAKHTPKTRKLTCTACGRNGFCVETWGGEGC